MYSIDRANTVVRTRRYFSRYMSQSHRKACASPIIDRLERKTGETCWAVLIVFLIAGFWSQAGWCRWVDDRCVEFSESRGTVSARNYKYGKLKWLGDTSDRPGFMITEMINGRCCGGRQAVRWSWDRWWMSTGVNMTKEIICIYPLKWQHPVLSNLRCKFNRSPAHWQSDWN